MRRAMYVIVLLVLVLHVQQTVPQTVQCYDIFQTSDGTCRNILGTLQVDDCCMNPAYGYLDKDNKCKSCRLASWTTWSPWSECSVTCTEGVRQRQRACYGIGTCDDPHHLGFKQTESCEDISCCPVNGGWSKWSEWQPCSVTCERGQKKRTRTCSNPPPKCRGTCQGSSEEVEICDTGIVCPTHGGWSAWGNWGACAGTCKKEGHLAPEKYRQRTCTNPPPSIVPRGNDCSGSNRENQHCTHLPFCPVNGNWGAWSEPDPCSVTCGVGRETYHRQCNNPAPKYGGQSCQGENTKLQLCVTQKNCPANGMWTEWSEWTHCNSPNERKITCKNRLGRRRRLRDCLGREYGGAYCQGEGIDFSQCYDIQDCKAGPEEQIPSAIWSEWSEWSYCKPDCGEHSTRTRKRVCQPDISKYSNPMRDMFAGNPDIQCPPLEKTNETRACLNLPPC